MAFENVVIRNMHMVGMHHHGQREIAVGVLLKACHEADNKFDKNAIALTREGKKVGYLSSRHAKALVDIFVYGAAKSSVYAKVSSESSVKCRRQGPMQHLTMGFKVYKEQYGIVVQRLEENGLLVSRKEAKM